MNPTVLLFILRLLSAVLLLGFLGLIAWYIYKDISTTTALMSERQTSYGSLEAISCEYNEEMIGRHYPLMPVTSIGRSPGNTIVFDDEYVSNEHTLISLRGGRWWLEDLGSRNGTLLNDLQLDTVTVLSAGDVVTIGRTRLRIEF